MRNPTGIQQTSQEIYTTKPSIARVYDYVLGGHNNFAVDRDAMRALAKTLPDAQLQDAARTARAFLVRGVRYLAAAGIRQFLDLGSGLPTMERTLTKWRNAMRPTREWSMWTSIRWSVRTPTGCWLKMAEPGWSLQTCAIRDSYSTTRTYCS